MKAVQDPRLRDLWVALASTFIGALGMLAALPARAGTTTADHSKFKELQGPFASGEAVTQVCLSCHQDAATRRLGSLPGVHVPGRDRQSWLDRLGWFVAAASLAGVLLHAAARVFTRSRHGGRLGGTHLEIPLHRYASDTRILIDDDAAAGRGMVAATLYPPLGALFGLVLRGITAAGRHAGAAPLTKHEGREPCTSDSCTTNAAVR